MEVMVRNVPKQSTYKALDNALRPYLDKLSIKSVHWMKHKDKTFAFLVFLYAADGERFLFQYGQTRKPGAKPGERPILARTRITFLGLPIYFEKSNNVPDTTILRGLLKEETDRKTRATKPESQAKAQFEPVTFTATSIACGAWSYFEGELVFVPQMDWKGSGVAKFGQRSLILSFDSGKRIDFRYGAIHEIITQKSPASIILSMKEAPRFFEKIDRALEDLLQQLQIPGQIRLSNRNGPERHRIPSLDQPHGQIAGICLVYRIMLPYVIVGADYDTQFKKMSKIPHLPTHMTRYTRERRSGQPYAAAMILLERELSDSSNGIPFEVSFQVHRLALNNYLPPSTVLQLLPEILQIVRRSGSKVCTKAIRKLFSQINYPSLEVDGSEFEVSNLIQYLRDNEGLSLTEDTFRFPDEQDSSELDTATNFATPASENEVLIHRAKLTPAGISLGGPEPETNNRVLRKYRQHHDYFLRVTLCDENSLPVRQNFKVSHEKIFRGRFKKVLDEGIAIAGRHYEFLGFSHSSLRMQTCWFMAPFIFQNGLVYYEQLIRDLGDFVNIQCPAKCAARIGQAFSDTPSTIMINSHNVVPDIKRNGRVFSDGVGTISEEIRNQICDRLKKRPRVKPTCFQIRYQGAKGMLALDSRLQGKSVNLRPSMIKFEGSTSTDLEICESAHKPLPLFLNRQLIKIMEDMGVPDNFFLELQETAVNQLRRITENPVNASSFLRRQRVGETIFLPWLLTELEFRNFDFLEDGFLRDIIEVALLFELRQLKHKTRIPVDQGWHLHGIMDETNFLEEGEIFCTVVVDGRTEIITGEKLIVSRSPALHPGDVQVVKGIQPPPGSPLWQINNCICFSQKGSRDLPSQLGGGDLDGDRFCIIFDEKARASRNPYPPADYPRTEPVNIHRAVKKSDMTDFFIQFMETDQLGQIAVQHRVLADVNDEGTFHPDCLQLAEMHSTAVDFSKTGIPVDMSKFPKRPKFRPDFEAPGPHVVVEKLSGVSLKEIEALDPKDEEDEDDDMPKYRYYESTKILGKLYRAIDEQKIFSDIKKSEAGISSQSTIIDAVWKYVQQECQLIQWKHLWGWAMDIRSMYENDLWRIMVEYSDHPSRPLSELEAFVGNILGKTGAQSRVQHDISTKMKEQVEENNKFIVNSILKDGGTQQSPEALERSMACLAVSLHQEENGRRKDELLSFKYIAAAVCLKQMERTFLGMV